MGLGDLLERRLIFRRAAAVVAIEVAKHYPCRPCSCFISFFLFRMESRGELDLSCAPEKLVVTLTVKAGRNTLKVFFHSTGSEVECTGHFESVTKTLLTKVQSVYTFRMHFESMIGVPESVQVRFLIDRRGTLEACGPQFQAAAVEY